MRIANVNDRLQLLDHAGRGTDVEEASNGRFSADPQAVFAHWPAFLEWAAGSDGATGTVMDENFLGAPVPRPPQIFGIGLNYRDHAAEANLAIPDEPVVFTKFPSSITGPRSAVTLPSGSVDYEVELVVVIGTGGHRIAAQDGWSHVAGLMVGQDLSERAVQMRGPAPQFSMGKSFPGFSPIGPVMVTPDELPGRDALGIRCSIGDQVLQDGNTTELIFDIPALISRLSAIVTLLAGDLIFTGTPAGVGVARSPQRFLAPGELLVSSIDGIGELRNRMV